jgi:hypothetical protein
MNPLAPYCGQNQTAHIAVPATIAYKYLDWEEGPWVMPPFASLYPPGSQTDARAQVPPAVYLTEIFAAQQTWPL